jgi:hypothetical protein
VFSHLAGCCHLFLTVIVMQGEEEEDKHDFVEKKEEAVSYLMPVILIFSVYIVISYITECDWPTVSQTAALRSAPCEL